MTARHKLGTGIGCALALLLSACGGSEEGANDSGAPADASNPDDGGRDATTAPNDAGIVGEGPVDAGYVDAGHVDAGFDAGIDYIVVTLTTGAEVPPCPSAGPAASGTASILVWPPDQWTGLTVSLSWQNLSSPLTMAHIHYGAAGVSGPVVLPFPNVTPPVSYTFSSMDYLAAQGAPVSFDAFKEELKAGKAYLNLHTQNCPGGELRGQIILP